MNETTKKLLFISFLAVLTIVVFFLFKESGYYAGFVSFTEKHLIITLFILFLLKILAIVWPPFAATVIIFGVMPIIGFWNAFFVDYIGEVIGSSLVYFIARKWGDRLVPKILGKSLYKRVMQIKINKDREFEFLFILRILGGNFFELVCYAAGLLGISYRNFILTTISAYFLLSFVFFKLAQGLFDRATFVISASLIAALLLFFKYLRNRYLKIE
ncbi:VTT domain-containing protein [Candidatus Nomurabacteria bacterium]|nr:VTT domain-containing protein [Candidatus Nomurabacteria bacterium]